MLNSGFDNLTFSSDPNIFPDENIKPIFTECSSIKTQFNEAYLPISIDSMYYDIVKINKLTNNKYFTLATLRLNKASLPEHFNDVPLLNHFFDIISIYEH